MSRRRSNSYDAFARGSGFENDDDLFEFQPKESLSDTPKDPPRRPTMDPKEPIVSRLEDMIRRRRAERMVDDSNKKANVTRPSIEPTAEMKVDAPNTPGAPKRPRMEGIPSDVNLNVTFKRAKPEVDTHLDEKKIKYEIVKHVDKNRDLYFVKLVSGALKRKSFHSLINVEQEIERDNSVTILGAVDNFDVKIKYSYNEQLLHAWATVLGKVIDMIDPAVKLSDSGWSKSKIVYERIMKNDMTLLAFARYVAFIMMSESNNMIPRNKTRYVIDDQSKIEDERVLSLMRALKNEMGILDPTLASFYLPN